MNNQQGKALVFSIIILLLGAILLAVTNPDKDQHLDAIHRKLSGQDAITGLLARGLLAVSPPAYHHAALISYTRFSDKLSSIGVLGYVWVDESAFK